VCRDSGILPDPSKSPRTSRLPWRAKPRSVLDIRGLFRDSGAASMLRLRDALPSLGMSLGMVLLPGSARAQEYVGPQKCTTCHASLAAPAWKKYHQGSLAQVDQGKGPQWAKAVGGSTKDPRCLRCHAPAPLASGPGSVSCESCHGPGKGYLIPHRQDSFFASPNRQGLKDLYNNPSAVANVCVTCHVLGSEDKDLAAAGHPTGGNFEAGSKLQTMSHWPSDEAEGVSAGPRKRTYGAAFYGSVSSQAKPILQARLQALGNVTVALVAPTTSQKPGPKGSAPVAAPATPAQGPSDFRDLQPGELIKILPDAPAGDYPPPPVPRSLPPTVAVATPEAPARAPVTPGPGPAAPGPPARPVAPSDPREEAARVLTRLLQAKKRIDVPAPRKATEIAGDELLSVEDEILALALETLGRPRE
jgi:hypothetical protein